MPDEMKSPQTRSDRSSQERSRGMDNEGNLDIPGFMPVAAPRDGAGRLIPRLHVPLIAAEDVKPHLGSPSHYKEGYSAFCLVNGWMAENDIPELVRLTLDTVPALQQAILLEGFLEREVSLGDGARNSQTDLLCLLDINKQLVVMSVEGKVRETFGNLVVKELETASDFKKSRIERLAQVLGLSLEEAKPLRYQLIHRTAAAIFEAQRFHSQTAIMMVHSYDPADAGFADYRQFAEAIGFQPVEPTYTVGPRPFDGVSLYLGWTADRPSSEGCIIVNRRKTDDGFFEDD